MLTEKLLARREEVLARHAVLESVPGSGWHADDPAFRSGGGNRITDRPVAIQINTRVYFVGPDVATVRAACAAWKPPADDLTGIQAHAIDVIATLADDAEEDVIKLASQDFNALGPVFAEAGLKVCLTGLS